MKTIIELITEINSSLKELERRGKEVTDYDNKKRKIKKITIMGGKIHALLEGEW
jgi:hypothetical protein